MNATWKKIVAVAFKWRRSEVINQSCVSSLRPHPSVFKNQCPRESRLLTSHISCFPASFFYKDLPLAAQKGESTYLIRAILFFFFDNLFHFTRPDVDVLFRFSALSFFLSFPHINSPHHRELLFLSTEEQEDKRYKK